MAGSMPLAFTQEDFLVLKSKISQTLKFVSCSFGIFTKQLKVINNKKVLLRERKRHTTCHVLSTPSVVTPGYPPILTWGGTLLGGPYLGPPSRVPLILIWLGGGGYLTRVPPGRVPPILTWHSGKCCKALWDMGTPPQCLPMAFWEMLQSIMGYGYPPRCLPMAFWEMLQSIMGYGYPPVDRQMDGRTDACQNITFPSYYVRGR